MAYVLATRGRLPDNLDKLLREMREIIGDVSEREVRAAIKWALRQLPLRSPHPPRQPRKPLRPPQINHRSISKPVRQLVALLVGQPSAPLRRLQKSALSDLRMGAHQRLALRSPPRLIARIARTPLLIRQGHCAILRKRPPEITPRRAPPITPGPPMLAKTREAPTPNTWGMTATGNAAGAVFGAF